MTSNKQWFEEESFWLNYAPIMFDEQHWAEASGVAQAIRRIAGIKEGDAILDVCCGPGRISVELALLGLSVTGVDIMGAFLEAAKESAKDEGVSINFLKTDMRAFTTQKPFKAAINVYNSFGYCSSVQEDLLILKNVYEALEDNGTFILECISRETAALHFTAGEWFERAGMTVLTEFGVAGLWEGLRSKWILIKGNGERIEHEFVQRLYSAKELKDYILDIGFRDVKAYGGWNLAPYDQNASSMVMVCKK